MRDHAAIDQRSLAMARAIAARIDGDPLQAGLTKARAVCRRWLTLPDPCPAVREWLTLLEQPWPVVRELLLDPGERGQRLRQNSPFCGVLSQGERLALYRAHQAGSDSSKDTAEPRDDA